MNTPNDKPTVRLVGEDGNAFAILGRCQRAAREAGWPRERINQFISQATCGDYSLLLATVDVWFDVE